MLTRRELLRSTAAGASALFVPSFLTAQDPKGFTLPKLPYAFDALEPHIDAKTMEIHHDRHHQAYVDNLNKALAKHPDWLAKPIVEVVRDYKKLPPDLQMPVRNNGGGHLNHTWFWQMMAKTGAGGAPKGELLKAIEGSFSNMDGFKKEFVAAALAQFGSGWAWLVKGKDKPLAIVKTANQDNPVTEGMTPILGCDVWEHAYYLKYQNKRADYVNAWFNVVNWNFVADLHAKK
ncbi:MAG: superoxide dismutase [Planctomycetia bacterium]|nr:superoxide dismutase [Planctomycetia bacterium]